MHGEEEWVQGETKVELCKRVALLSALAGDEPGEDAELRIPYSQIGLTRVAHVKEMNQLGEMQLNFLANCVARDGVVSISAIILPHYNVWVT